MMKDCRAVIPAPTEKGEPTTLTWSVHLLRRDPKRLPPTLFCLAAALFGGLIVFHDVRMAFLPVAALVLSLAEYFFPIHYLLTPEKAVCRFGLTHLEMPWADVRRVYIAEEGLKLSPLRTPGSRWEAMRGIFLRYGPITPEDVQARVREFREKAQADA